MLVYEYRFTRHRVAETPATIRSPRDVTLALARAMLLHAEGESLIVVALDTRNHVIGVERVYQGNVSSSLVRISELFRFVIRVNATSLIVVHNHPSGDPTPSPDDLHLTASIGAAAKLLEIRFLDHVVIGEGEAFRSLRDMGVVFDV